MTRWRNRVIVVAAAVAAVTSACSNDEPLVPPAAAAEAQPGGTLRVGILEPRTVAPWLTSRFDPYGSLIVETMCDSLFELDHETGEFLPALVSQWKMPNPSQLSAKLHKGLRFSDGAKVDAEDITTSYARVAKSETGSPVADLLAPLSGWDQLRELPATGEDPRLRDRLAGVRSPEPTSVEIRAGADAPDVFTVLDHPVGSVIPYDRFRQDPQAMERQPICVGPYRLAEPWAPGQQVIRLLRSGSYHAENVAYSRGGQGWVDEIEFHVLPDGPALHQAFVEGRVHLAYLPDNLVPAATQERPADVVVAALPTVEYLGLPVKVEPWSNADVRRAVSLAIDRQALVDAGLGGIGSPADSFVPPTLGTNYLTGDRRDETACAKTMPPKGDVEAAKEVLREADITLEGVPVTLAFNDEFGNRQLVEAVAEQLRTRLGLDVTLEPQNWETYLTVATSTTGFPTPFRLSWAEQYADPVRYLGPLFSRSTLTSDNFSRYTSKEYDELLEDAVEQVNPEDRHALYAEAENIICTDLPMVPLVFGARAYLVQHGTIASAVGAIGDLTTGQPLLRELYVKQ